MAIKPRTAAIFIGALLAVAALGLLDYLTGPGVRSALFFVLPVLFVGWNLPRRAIVVVALFSAIVWGAVRWYAPEVPDVADTLISTVDSLIVFMVAGLAFATIRRERDRLRAANDRIHELLEKEATAARTDALTGLPNSRDFLQRLEPEIARCHREHTPLCLLYLDLDNFKQVNDRHGHFEGDRVLQRVADALRSCLRAADIPARLGGDEFAALLWQADRVGAEGVGERVLAAVRQIGADYPQCSLGVSVGIAWFETPPANSLEVVRSADEAMYEAKRDGKGRTRVVQFSPPASAAR